MEGASHEKDVEYVVPSMALMASGPYSTRTYAGRNGACVKYLT